MVSSNKILVMIPTYNEVENVAKISGDILDLNLPADILFIDDNSTDGTGAKLDNIKGMHVRGEKICTIHVIHRPGKLGVGSAHKVGITYAYNEGFTTLITMDSDGTHDPKDIPEFLRFSSGHYEDKQIVVGSRHILRDSLDGWSAWRKFVTHIGHMLTTTLLQMPYDATGAFRLYKLDKIPQSIFSKVKRDDYAFFYESLAILNANKLNIMEVPIKLAARSAGHSKLKITDLVNSLLYMVKLRYNFHFNKEQVLL